MAGGPPCQPFSLGGKHKAEQDKRDMFPYAIRAIERLTPKAFVFENVKGLLRDSFSEYFEYILLRLTFPKVSAELNLDWQDHLETLRSIKRIAYAGIKYDVSYKLINSADYGIPQTRERVVIVGIRSDLSVNWKFPPQTHSEDRLLWEKYITNQYWDRHKTHKLEVNTTSDFLQDDISKLQDKYGMFEPELLPWNTIRDALHGVPDPKSVHRIIDHIFRDGARTYPGHTGSAFDWPSKTIKAGGHGVPGGENMIRYPDSSIRYLTVYEAKLIQTFPDNFAIKGPWGEAMRQIGNAVPVKLGKIIGLELFKRLNSQKIHSHKSRSNVKMLIS